MARTDWTSKDTVRPADMNQIGQEINDLESSATVWLGVTEGTDTEYTVTSNKVSSLYESLRVSFRAHQTSGTNPTLQINSLGAVPLKKPNGRAAKLDADGVYTAVYSAASFILQGEGGEYGTATAADVLAPKSIGTDNGIVTGTMPTQGDQFKSGSWTNPDGDSYVDTYVDVDGGYYPPGTQVTIQAYDPNLVSNNIRADAKVFGVDGDPNVIDTYMDDGYAAVNDDLLENKRAFVNGKMLYGGIKNYKNIHFGGQLVPKSGANIGVKPTRTGLMDVTTELNVPIPNKLPENIRAGVDIGGTVGTFGAIKRIIRGTTNFTGLNLAFSTFAPAVNRDCSIIFHETTCTSSNPIHHKTTAILSNDNEVSCYQYRNYQPTTVRWTIVEFHPSAVKYKYRAIVERIVGNAGKSVTIPVAVNPEKTLVVAAYSTTGTNLEIPGYYDPVVQFSSSREIVLIGATSTTTSDIVYEDWEVQVLELY